MEIALARCKKTGDGACGVLNSRKTLCTVNSAQVVLKSPRLDAYSSGVAIYSAYIGRMAVPVQHSRSQKFFTCLLLHTDNRLNWCRSDEVFTL